MFELTRTDAHHMILRKSPTIPAGVSGDVDSLDDESMTANRGESKLCGCRRAISTSENGYVPTQNGNCPHSDEARATGSTAGGECRGVEVYKEGDCGCVFSLCPPSRPQGVLSFPPTQPTPLLILPLPSATMFRFKSIALVTALCTSSAFAAPKLVQRDDGVTGMSTILLSAPRHP